MKLSRLIASAALAVAATQVATAVAHAAPPTPQSKPLNVNVAPHVNYKAYQDHNAAVITVDGAGKLIVANGKFQIRSKDGKVLAGVPLSANIGDIAVPVKASIHGNTARLTPVLDRRTARYQPINFDERAANSLAAKRNVALSFENEAPFKNRYEREKDAWTRFTSTVTLGVAIGGIVGAVIAGVTGCVLGGAAGAGVSSPLIALLVPVVGATAAGCIVGGALFAPVGAIIGSIFVGAPVAIAAGIQYIATINAPFKKPKEKKSVAAAPVR